MIDAGHLHAGGEKRHAVRKQRCRQQIEIAGIGQHRAVHGLVVGQRRLGLEPDMLHRLALVRVEHVPGFDRPHVDRHFPAHRFAQRFRHPIQGIDPGTAQLVVAGQLFRAHDVGHGHLMGIARLLDMKRGQHGKDRSAVLDGLYASGGKASAVADVVDFIDDGGLHVARAQKIAVHGMRLLGRIHGARGRNHGLPRDLTTEHALAADIARTAAKQPLLQRLQIQLIEQILNQTLSIP